MSNENNQNLEADLFTTEGKLRHENQFLKDRVTNLEVFKENFFTLHYDLIEVRERVSQLEEQLGLDKLKQQITSTTTAQEDSLPDDIEESNDELLEYFHHALNATSLQDLIMSLFQSADGLAKDIVVQVREDGTELDFCLDESIKNENLKHIKEYVDKGEVIDVGEKTILNYKHLSVIYAPLTDDKKISDKQLKDFMKIISLGANTRTSTLKQRTELITLKENIFKIFKKINLSFDSLQSDLESNIINISDIYTGFMFKLLTNLQRMKLDKSHINLIDIMVNDTKSELLLALTTSMSVDKDFVKTLKRLESAYEKIYKENQV